MLNLAVKCSYVVRLHINCFMFFRPEMTFWVRLSWSWLTGPYRLSRKGKSFPVRTTYSGHAGNTYIHIIIMIAFI